MMGISLNNLCSSCTNIGCEFQFGIVMTECAFYMPPYIEPDNCGNYVVINEEREDNDERGNFRYHHQNSYRS